MKVLADLISEAMVAFSKSADESQHAKTFDAKIVGKMHRILLSLEAHKKHKAIDSVFEKVCDLFKTHRERFDDNQSVAFEYFVDVKSVSLNVALFHLCTSLFAANSHTFPHCTCDARWTTCCELVPEILRTTSLYTLPINAQ